jgi:hypothetical protein
MPGASDAYLAQNDPSDVQAAATSSGPKPIGGYAWNSTHPSDPSVAMGAPTNTYGTPWEGGPQTYYPGAEYEIGREMDAGTVLQLQEALRQAGYLGATTAITPGVFSSSTATAFSKLLGDANGLGVNWEQLLGATVDVGTSGRSGGGGGGGGGTRINLPDPEQVKAAGSQSAQQVIGRALNPTEQGQLVDTVNAGVTAHAQDPNAGSYDLQSNILKNVRSMNPGEAKVHDTAAAFDAFQAMLGAGGLNPSRPSFGNSYSGLGA